MTQNWRALLGPYGVWRSVSMVTPELAKDLEQLGYGALWLGGSPSADLKIVDALLAATDELVVATGIVNMWQSDAHEVATSFHRIEASHPGRFLLGVGAGHREADQQYAKPYDVLVAYVDTLIDDGVPSDSLVLAALGPKMLRLVGRADRRRAPVPGDRAVRQPGQGDPRSRAADGRRAQGGHRSRSAGGTRDRPACECGGPTSAWSTTPLTCAGSAGPTTTSPTAAATRSSMRWSRTVTRSQRRRAARQVHRRRRRSRLHPASARHRRGRPGSGLPRARSRVGAVTSSAICV